MSKSENCSVEHHMQTHDVKHVSHNEKVHVYILYLRNTLHTSLKTPGPTKYTVLKKRLKLQKTRFIVHFPNLNLLILMDT